MECGRLSGPVIFHVIIQLWAVRCFLLYLQVTRQFELLGEAMEGAWLAAAAARYQSSALGRPSRVE